VQRGMQVFTFVDSDWRKRRITNQVNGTDEQFNTPVLIAWPFLIQVFPKLINENLIFSEIARLYMSLPAGCTLLNFMMFIPCHA
jgi:hypothetical protein